jgi:allantoin racemase
MAKVLVLVPFPLNAENLAQREVQQEAARLGPDIEFHYRTVKAAPSNYVSHHDYVLADVGMLEAGLSAQDDGYDAVCIDTMSDSGVSALRSVLDIPVFGPGRVSMLVALMLGDRFSILTMWEGWRGLYKKTLQELEVGSRCVSIRPIGVAPDNRNLLAGKKDELLPKLLAEANRCVDEDGAHVILLGSTTMHESHAYLAEHLSVPIINPGPLSYRMAETALALGLTHSRSSYPSPIVQKDDLFHIMLDAAAAAAGRDA